MGFIKFITVYDDAEQMIFSESVLKSHNISAYPPVYFCNNKPYYDGLNTNVSEFAALKAANPMIRPCIYEKVFYDAFVQAYNEGYFSVIVVCPHTKWYPYYKQATLAVNKFKRSRSFDFSTFSINVIDSKSFAAGVLLQTLSMAQEYEMCHYSPEEIVQRGKINALKNCTYILNKSSLFGEPDEGITAFKSVGYKLNKLEISKSHDSVKYDMFADIVSKQILKADCGYAVSVGADCDYAGSVIGRIKSQTGKDPICVNCYSVASADVLGNSSICINVYL